MQATEIQSTLTAAIARSRSHNEIVSIEIEGADIATVRAELNAIYDGEIDDSQENDGSYGIWGYTDDMAESEMDWRLNVTLAAKENEYPTTTDYVAGYAIQHDNSGVGHNWQRISRDDIPASIVEEIEGEIITGNVDSCDDYVASNGCHYRW